MGTQVKGNKGARRSDIPPSSLGRNGPTGRPVRVCGWHLGHVVRRLSFAGESADRRPSGRAKPRATRESAALGARKCGPDSPADTAVRAFRVLISGGDQRVTTEMLDAGLRGPSPKAETNPLGRGRPARSFILFRQSGALEPPAMGPRASRVDVVSHEARPGWSAGLRGSRGGEERARAAMHDDRG